MRRLALVLLLLGLVTCGGAQSVFSLPVGTCFDDQEDADEISSVPAVDCDEPHDNEVFALIEYTDTDVYPGADEMRAIGTELCIDQFEDYVGIDYPTSTLDVFSIYPTEASWSDGDRELVCALYDVDLAKLTGSMQGSAQ